MTDRELDEAESVVKGLDRPDHVAYGQMFEYKWFDESDRWDSDTMAKASVELAKRAAYIIDGILLESLKAK